ncbi:hypothetical protein GGR56DRAFT_123411 [Xylariaceae sp. FL0804]|nr:hypothetical protein GGR56DRAFT_123411 [Xylariaceae sp. FL0804]
MRQPRSLLLPAHVLRRATSRVSIGRRGGDGGSCSNRNNALPQPAAATLSTFARPPLTVRNEPRRGGPGPGGAAHGLRTTTSPPTTTMQQQTRNYFGDNKPGTWKQDSPPRSNFRSPQSSATTSEEFERLMSEPGSKGPERRGRGSYNPIRHVSNDDIPCESVMILSPETGEPGPPQAKRDVLSFMNLTTHRLEMIGQPDARGRVRCRVVRLADQGRGAADRKPRTRGPPPPQLPASRSPTNHAIPAEHVAIQSKFHPGFGPILPLADALAIMNLDTHMLEALKPMDREQLERAVEADHAAADSTGGRRPPRPPREVMMCRVADLAERARRLAEAENSQRALARNTKELELTWAIGAHDWRRKADRLQQWLRAGYRVSVAVAPKKTRGSQRPPEVAPKDRDALLASIRAAAAEVAGARAARPEQLGGSRKGPTAQLSFENPTASREKGMKGKKGQQDGGGEEEEEQQVGDDEVGDLPEEEGQQAEAPDGEAAPNRV